MMGKSFTSKLMLFAAGIYLSGCVATMPITATSNPIPKTGLKQGIAKCTGILSFPLTGDCSIEAAARQGGITKISTVDQKVNNMLVFREVITTVTGE